MICAVAVDVTRLSVYGTMALKGGFESLRDVHSASLLVTAALSAFLGSFVGARVMHKITMRLVRRLVGTLLLALGTAIALGLVWTRRRHCAGFRFRQGLISLGYRHGPTGFSRSSVPAVEPRSKSTRRPRPSYLIRRRSQRKRRWIFRRRSGN